MSLQPSSVRSLRQNRSSRYSSPASLARPSEASLVQAEATPSTNVSRVNENAAGADRAQSRLTEWIEPRTQNTATFQDYGLDRVGYFEHMQPLGQGPTAKTMQRLKLNFGAGKISSVPRRNAATAAVDVGQAVRDTPGISDEPASPIVEAPGNASEMDVEMNDGVQIETDLMSDATPIPTTEDNVTRLQSPKLPQSVKIEPEEMDYIPDGSRGSTNSMPRQSARYSPSRIVKMSGNLSHDIAHQELRGAAELARRSGSEELAAGIEYALKKHKPDSAISHYVENVCLAQLDRLTFEDSKAWNHAVKKGIRRYRRQSEQATTASVRSDSVAPNIHTSMPSSARTTKHALSNTQGTQNILGGLPPSEKSRGSMHNRPRPASGFTTINGDSNKENGYESHFRIVNQSGFDLSSQMSINQPHSAKSKIVFKSPRRQRAESVSSMSSLSSARSITPGPEVVKVKRTGVNKLVDAVSEQAGPSSKAVVRVRGRRSRPEEPNEVSDMDTILRQGQTVNELVKKRKYLKQSTLKQLTPAQQEEVEAEEHRLRTNQFFDYQTKRWNGESNVRNYRDLPVTSNRVYQNPPAPVVHAQAIVVPVLSFMSAAFDNAPPSINGDVHGNDYLRSDGLESSPASSSSRPGSVQPTIREANKMNLDDTPLASSRGSTPAFVTKLGRAKRTAAAAAAQTTTQMYNLSNGVKTFPEDDASAASDREGRGDGLDDSHDLCDYCHQSRGKGNDQLICCDSCPNVYHFDHVEPKIKRVPKGSWFCPDCRAEKRPKSSTGPSDSMWESLYENISFEGLKQYKLPVSIRWYYAYVDADDHGDYKDEPYPNELFRQRLLKQKRNGDAFHPFDYTQATTDTTPSFPRICSHCGLGTEGTRPIIPCDFCDNQFHFDCTSPTLNADPIKYGDKGVRASRWRCPRHVENDLVRVAFVEVPQGMRGRRYKRRVPKDPAALGFFASPQLQELRQPVNNNGLVDVVMSDQTRRQLDQGCDLEMFQAGLRHVSLVQVIQKKSEHAIRMDFLGKAKKDFYDDAYNPRYKTIPGYLTQYHAKSWLPDRERYFDAENHQESTLRLIKASNMKAAWLETATKRTVTKRKYDQLEEGASIPIDQAGEDASASEAVHDVDMHDEVQEQPVNKARRLSQTDTQHEKEISHRLREQSPRTQSALRGLIDFSLQDRDRLPLSADTAKARIGGTMLDLLQAGEHVQQEVDSDDLENLKLMQRLLEKKIEAVQDRLSARPSAITERTGVSSRT